MEEGTRRCCPMSTPHNVVDAESPLRCLPGESSATSSPEGDTDFRQYQLVRLFCPLAA